MNMYLGFTMGRLYSTETAQAGGEINYWQIAGLVHFLGGSRFSIDNKSYKSK